MGLIRYRKSNNDGQYNGHTHSTRGRGNSKS